MRRSLCECIYYYGGDRLVWDVGYFDFNLGIKYCLVGFVVKVLVVVFFVVNKGSLVWFVFL